MSKLIKIIDIKNNSEASILEGILKNENIPFIIKSYHDTAYDGIFQTQYGFGFILAPEEYKDIIIQIYHELSAKKTP
jgi:hypothetical protein